MRSFQKNSPARSSAYSEPSVIPPEQRGRDGTEGELPLPTGRKPYGTAFLHPTQPPKHPHGVRRLS